MKRSGVVEPLPTGALIAYRARYSTEVEFGIPEDIPITGTQTIHRKSYKRKGYTKKDGTYVPPTIIKAHDVSYKNKRLIRMRPKLSKFEYGKPMFRVINKIKARPGQFFLTRAVEKGLPFLGQDVAFYMKRIGKVN